MSEQGNQVLLNDWVAQRGGNAKITGKNALNLNPIIRADSSGERELLLAWWWL